MAYTPTDWTTGDVLTEVLIDKMETGISDAHTLVADAQADADTANTALAGITLLTGTTVLGNANLSPSAGRNDDVTVTGAAVGDHVALALPTTWPIFLSANAFVVSADTVRIGFVNAGSSSVTRPAGTYGVIVFH